MEWRRTAAASRKPVTEEPLLHLMSEMAWAITIGSSPSSLLDCRLWCVSRTLMEDDESLPFSVAKKPTVDVFAGNKDDGDFKRERMETM